MDIWTRIEISGPRKAEYTLYYNMVDGDINDVGMRLSHRGSSNESIVKGPIVLVKRINDKMMPFNDVDIDYIIDGKKPPSKCILM
jgi:hypothetical protein